MPRRLARVAAPRLLGLTRVHRHRAGMPGPRPAGTLRRLERGGWCDALRPGLPRRLVPVQLMCAQLLRGHGRLVHRLPRVAGRVGQVPRHPHPHRDRHRHRCLHLYHPACLGAVHRRQRQRGSGAGLRPRRLVAVCRAGACGGGRGRRRHLVLLCVCREGADTLLAPRPIPLPPHRSCPLSARRRPSSSRRRCGPCSGALLCCR